MRTSLLKVTAAAAAGLAIACAAVTPASAACTRLAASVNDYGKDGPTKDAKQLLDKYIAKWAKDHGIAKYTTGKKDVTCELFLDVILFDEHTCKAEASVCWDGPPVKGAIQAKSGESAPAATATDESKPKAKAAKVAKPAEGSVGETAATEAAKPAKSESNIETGSTEKADAAAKKAAEKAAAMKAEEDAARAEAEAAATADPDPSSPNYGGKNPAQN